jgi:hypothetical protein
MGSGLAKDGGGGREGEPAAGAVPAGPGKAAAAAAAGAQASLTQVVPAGSPTPPAAKGGAAGKADDEAAREEKAGGRDSPREPARPTITLELRPETEGCVQAVPSRTVSALLGEESGGAAPTFSDCLEALQSCDGWSAAQRERFLRRINTRALDFLVDEHDAQGNTLLILAAMGHQAEVVEMLLGHGAVPDHQNASGFSALHYCSSRPSESWRYESSVAIARLLLKANANPNVTEGSMGCTPLHYAASENNRLVCDMLLRQGAEPGVRCKSGFLPEAYARANGHDELAEYLHKKAVRRVNGEVRARVARMEAQGGHGWEKHFDEETKKWFYYNARSQKSTWDRPVEMDVNASGSSSDSSDSSDSSSDSSSSDSDSDSDDVDGAPAGSAGAGAGAGRAAPGSPGGGETAQLRQQLLDMQARLEEAQARAALEASEKERLEQLSKDADARFEAQMAALKAQLANSSDGESSKRVEALRREFEESKRRDVDKLKQAMERERLAAIAEIEARQAEERARHAAELTKQTEQLSKMEEQLQAELKEKKQYYNQIEELKGSIRVCARVRPLDRREKERGNEDVLEVFGNNIRLKTQKTDAKGQARVEEKTWAFDKVLGPGRGQKDVFEDSERLIQSAVDGFNVCIFAYGQTGAGKTYTMSGPEEDPGILPRAVSTLFECMAKASKHYEFTAELYMLELHMDQLVDLLAEKGGKKIGDTASAFQIKKDEFGVVYVENINVVAVESAKETMDQIHRGESRRTTKSTNMNDASSRSHLVISVVIKSENRKTQEITSGKLTLVDLAGSERVAKSGAEGQTFTEATSINQALSALGEVINALTTNAKHVPYRNNPLTQLMSDSIGGNAKTLMIVNVSPADYNALETTASLNFAMRCKAVHNAASKGFETKEIAILRREIQKLRKANGLT